MNLLFRLLWLPMPILLVLLACLGAAGGQWMAHWSFDKLDEVRARYRQSLSVQGDLLHIIDRRIPLTDVQLVRRQGHRVRLVMNDDANITLAAPLDTVNRDWLFSALNDIPGARDRGDAEDIPAEMRALKPDRQGLKA